MFGSCFKYGMGFSDGPGRISTKDHHSSHLWFTGYFHIFVSLIIITQVVLCHCFKKFYSIKAKICPGIDLQAWGTFVKKEILLIQNLVHSQVTALVTQWLQNMGLILGRIILRLEKNWYAAVLPFLVLSIKITEYQLVH